MPLSFSHPFDARSELPQLVIDFFVAAVKVINAINLCAAARRETGDDQGRGSSQVAGHNGSAAQFRAPLDDRAWPLNGNFRSEPGKLADVHEARFKNSFR